MRIVYLGPNSAVLDYLLSVEQEVSWATQPGYPADWLVSYGYRRILTPEQLSLYSHAVNLHISLLPWNRGADPNYWSWRDRTPKGVSIHYIDAGVDTGPILAQQEVAFGPDETLRTSYARLRGTVEALFAQEWPRIRFAPEGTPQPAGGSYHHRTDLPELSDGWDTPCSALG